MAQTQRVSGVATKVRHFDDKTAVRYHATDVVVFDEELVTLQSGGWHTVTTKTRMNQTSRQFGLGFTVYQQDFDWFVDTADGKTRDYSDGMTFPRRQA
jgi:hypothetical protein